MCECVSRHEMCCLAETFLGWCLFLPLYISPDFSVMLKSHHQTITRLMKTLQLLLHPLWNSDSLQPCIEMNCYVTQTAGHTNHTLVRFWLFLIPSMRNSAPSSLIGLQPILQCITINTVSSALIVHSLESTQCVSLLQKWAQSLHSFRLDFTSMQTLFVNQ